MTVPPKIATFALTGIPLFAVAPSALAQEADTLNYSIAIDCRHGALASEGTAALYEIVGVSDAGEDSIIDGDWEQTAAPGYGVCPVPVDDAR